MKMTPLVRLLAAVAVLLLSAPALAEPALWTIKNAHTTIYLFGTLHMLPADTDWRYPALESALQASGSLTIELTDSDPTSMQELVREHGLDPTHPLSGKLTPAERTALATAAAAVEIPGGAESLDIMRPWLAALTLAGAPLKQGGLDAEHGVDKLLQAQMTEAGKPVNGLETAAQQIGFLANLPAPLQLDFLRSTLHDVDQDNAQFAALIVAWKAGDTDAIARLENDEIRKASPGLYKTLLVDRNKAWATKIAAMLQQPGTVFIAVGAAHLAGPDSVQAQLQQLGINTARN